MNDERNRDKRLELAPVLRSTNDDLQMTIKSINYGRSSDWKLRFRSRRSYSQDKSLTDVTSERTFET